MPQLIHLTSAEKYVLRAILSTDSTQWRINRNIHCECSISIDNPMLASSCFDFFTKTNVQKVFGPRTTFFIQLNPAHIKIEMPHHVFVNKISPNLNQNKGFILFTEIHREYYLEISSLYSEIPSLEELCAMRLRARGPLTPQQASILPPELRNRVFIQHPNGSCFLL